MKRLRLTDNQCRIFLRDMKDFGYPRLSFDDVRRIADEVAEGTQSDTNVIATIMANQIDEATKGRS